MFIFWICNVAKNSDWELDCVAVSDKNLLSNYDYTVAKPNADPRQILAKHVDMLRWMEQDAEDGSYISRVISAKFPSVLVCRLHI